MSVPKFIPNPNDLEEQIIKKYQTKDQRKKPKMKVSGKEVLKLKKIIEGEKK